MIYDMLAPTAQGMSPNTLQSSLVNRYFDPQMLQTALNNYPSPYQQNQQTAQSGQQNNSSFSPPMPMRNMLYLNNLQRAHNYYQTLPPLPQTPAPQAQPQPLPPTPQAPAAPQQPDMSKYIEAGRGALNHAMRYFR